MWLFTKYGFFSVTQSGKKTVQVRGRSRRHFNRLIQRFPELVKCRILEYPGRDYQYRIIVLKTIWANIMSQLTLEIDYTNFKDAVKDGAPNDFRYNILLHKVWFEGWSELEERSPMYDNDTDELDKSPLIKTTPLTRDEVMRYQGEILPERKPVK